MSMRSIKIAGLAFTGSTFEACLLVLVCGVALICLLQSVEKDLPMVVIYGLQFRFHEHHLLWSISSTLFGLICGNGGLLYFRYEQT